MVSDHLFHASERDVLTGILTLNRSVVLSKIEGLSHEDGTRRLVPSVTTILGVVSHLAWVERYWFCSVLMGESMDFPWSDENPDGEFSVDEGDNGSDIAALYRRCIAEADANIQRVPDLTDLAKPAEWTRGDPPSLRWILAHMIEETARHAGHLDILREQTDGSIGYEPS